MATNAVFLWGIGYQNQLLVGQPLYDMLTDRVPRKPSQWAVGPSGVRDAWIVGRDYTLWCTARWIPDGGDGSLASPFSGPTGWQAFFDWARDTNPFRFVPDATYPNAYVDGCYLVEPLEKGPLGALSPDILRNIAFQICNATTDFHQALRGLFFEYRPGASLADLGGTFARADAATCATYVDAQGMVRTVAANVARDAHFIGGVRTLLLEGARTNLVVRSDELATGWTLGGGAGAVNAYATYAGVAFSHVTGNGDVHRAVTLTGDGVKALSLLCRWTGVAGLFQLALYDVTSSAYRARIQVTFDSVGNATAAAPVGTVLGITALADGVFRVLVQTTFCTAAHTHDVYAQNGGGLTDLLIAGVQVEDAAFPSSYIKTVAATVTRAADSLSFPYAPVPQAMTVYAQFVEQRVATATGRSWQIGDLANGAPRFLLYRSGGYDQAYHQSGAVVASGLAAAAAIGDTVEARATLDATGATTFGRSINGATEVVGATSAADALATAWAGNDLILNDAGDGSDRGFAAFRTLRIAAGVRTLAQMRAL